VLNLGLLFISLAFMRASPSDVPIGRSVLGVAVVFMVAANTLVTLSWYGWAIGVQLSLVEVLLSAGFLYLCLSIRGLPERFTQSLAAICGINAVMALVAWPWVLQFDGTATEAPQWLLWGQFVLILWSMLNWSRILRLAGNMDRLLSAALALGYFFLSSMVFVMLSPSVA